MKEDEFFPILNNNYQNGGFDWTAETLEWMVEGWISSWFTEDDDINHREACEVLVNILQNIQKMPEFEKRHKFFEKPKE